MRVAPMYRPLRKLAERTSDLVPDYVRGAIATKAAICGDVLDEARKLSQPGRHGPALHQLISRACDLLDEIDEMLVALDPISDGFPFAAAAALHRQLEHLQAGMTAERRAQAAASTPGAKR